MESAHLALMLSLIHIYNFILDFTGVYDDEFAKEKTSLTWIDCTDITGCDMYVSDEAEKQIGERVDSCLLYTSRCV